MPATSGLVQLCCIIVGLLTLPYTSHGLYNVDTGTLAQLKTRASASIFAHNGSVYLYGGVIKSSINREYSASGVLQPTNTFESISFDKHNGSLRNTILPEAPVGVSASQAVVLRDSNRVLFFGGDCPRCTNTSTLLLFEYQFDYQQWTILEVSEDSMAPPNGIVSATLAMDGKIYLEYQRDHFQSGFWSYDPDRSHFENLTHTLLSGDQYISRFCWTLPDGTVAFLTESDSAHSYSLADVRIYNTISRSWKVQHTAAKDQQLEHIPRNKRYFSVTADQAGRKVYIYGGVGIDQPYGAYSDFSILDTATWTWETLKPPGEPPYPQYQHGMALIDPQNLVVSGGISSSLWEFRVLQSRPFITKGDYWSDHFGVARITDNTTEWISNITRPALSTSYAGDNVPSNTTITGFVIAAVLGSVTMLGLLFLLCKFHRRLWRLCAKLYRVWIWNPRRGEATWTEMFRLIFKLFVTGSLVGLLIVNVSYVLHSPIATINYINNVHEAVVPDVRICVRGTSTVFLTCHSDALSPQDVNKMGFIRQLNTSIFKPAFAGDPEDTRCYLFAPSETFRLSTNKSAPSYNGSKILLRARYATHSLTNSTPSIYVTLYPPGLDPNRQVFYNEKQQLTDKEFNDWLRMEKYDNVRENIFTPGVGVYATIMYQHVVEETLVDSAWNTIGFASEYEKHLKLKTEFRSDPVDPVEDGNLDDTSARLFHTSVFLFPMSFTEVRTRQQRLHTLVSVLGVMGGALALLTAFMSILFGTRPASPWGFVQQLSVFNARQSLITDLRQSFYPWAIQSIPFIDAVAPPRSSHERMLLDKHTIQYCNEHQTSEQQAYDKSTAAAGHQYHTIDILESSRQPNEDQLRTSPSSCKETDAHLDDHLGSMRNVIDSLMETKRQMEYMQNRLQLLELVFNKYYIDPEIFHKLAASMRCDLATFTETLSHNHNHSMDIDNDPSPSSVPKAHSMPAELRNNGTTNLVNYSQSYSTKKAQVSETSASMKGREEMAEQRSPK